MHLSVIEVLTLTDEEVLYQTKDGVATITINRPTKYNALSIDVVTTLRQFMKQAETSPDVRTVVLTGAGEKAFSAGADISEFKDRDSKTIRPLTENGQELCKYIESMSKPVIACINGHALGGGCEVAMACDIRYASSNAKFGQPEINLGIMPGYGGTVRLPRIVGLGAAKEIVFSGDPILAQEALRIGLVNRVFDSVEALRTATTELAVKLSKKSGAAIKLIKKSMNNAWIMPSDKHLALEVNLFCESFGTEDKKEGVAAFLEKREAKFKHR